MRDTLTKQRKYPDSVQPGIPRLSSLKKGWQRRSIGELFSEVSRPVTMDDKTSYNLVIVKRARGGVVKRDTKKGKNIAVKSQFEVRTGDFLISKRQIVHGACGIVPAELDGSIVSNEYSVLRCTDLLDSRFLSYLTHTIYFQQTCFHSSIGVHIEKMIFKLSDWFNWKIDIPIISEQLKIAAILGAVDSKITGLRRKHELLTTYKRGLMEQIFTQQLRFKRNNGSEYPDWKSKPLGEIFSERSDKGSDHLELLSVTVKGGVIKRTEISSKDNSSSDKSTYKSVFPGDIAYNSMRMWQGAFGVSPYGGIVSPAYTVVTTRADDLPVFFAYYFKLKKTLHIFERFSQGLTSDTWNLKYPAFSKIYLLIPCAEEQKCIADFLSAIDAKIDTVAGQIEKMKQFKKGLLQQMFV